MTDYFKIAVRQARAQFPVTNAYLDRLMTAEERQEAAIRANNQRIVDQEIQAWLERSAAKPH